MLRRSILNELIQQIIREDLVYISIFKLLASTMPAVIKQNIRDCSRIGRNQGSQRIVTATVV